MAVAAHIEEIRTGIKTGRYGNEAAVSQGIVLRLLQALGWPTFNTETVCPEFSLEGRRVDFALCHPAAKPIAFIEVKQIGQGEGAERQLFEYAFHAGVPLAILTDGQEWHFFLPAEQGNYAERRVYKLDIVERDISESAARLTRYLEYAEICSGRAINAAREDYKNVSRNRQILATLPEAWSKLVEEEDDLLLELLADKTESLCGYKPDVDGVARFLREKVSVHIASPSVPPKAKPPATKPVVPDLTTIPTGPVPAARIGFSLDGRFVACKTGREVLVQVFEALSHRDATFPERFAARPKHGRTRRYLARSPEELYPGRPDLAREHYTKLKSGWYVGTNVSLAQIRRILGMACEVAGFHLGRELVLDLGE